MSLATISTSKISQKDILIVERKFYLAFVRKSVQQKAESEGNRINFPVKPQQNLK
jgi:hypothetical protein